MKTRYTHGGDEHIFVEIDEEMSLDAFFKSLTLASSLREKNIAGVTEICPANASFQVIFNPDKISPDAMLKELKHLEKSLEETKSIIDTRIIEVPVFYRDPWTEETLMRFRDRHQDPKSTDIEYSAKLNGYNTVEDFIEAHSSSLWIVTMVGFVAGLPFVYQLVDRERQIEVPKYLRPRTDTPKLTVGYGGCFGCIYSVRGAGGYQMFGITPMPIYDPKQELSYLKDFMVFFRPGDLIKFSSIDRTEYDEMLKETDNGQFEPRIRNFQFSLENFNKDNDGYNKILKETLYVN
ncbi:MAG TPA: carboxyltransferase domain-containing protein [Candidatus Dadabacteria bacterium]|jgi:KipI family sensor histidine kinase inhibitor|nr:carboxyltransferase domain-containing protein [Candidatus Dadabacteria bacterium]